MTPAVEMALFIIFAAGVVLPALMVVTARNLVRAAFALLPCFLSVAGLFVLLGGYFLAAIQVLIYAGAIMLLLLFVLTLTRNLGEEQVAAHNRQAGWAIIATGLIAAVTLGVVSRYHWPLGVARGPSDIGAIGEALLRSYLLPFEVASVVLLSAIVGAIVIARSERAQ